MIVHAEKLEDTMLWQEYLQKTGVNNQHADWIKIVYETAKSELKDIRITFKNYTLHDETHILNVLDAMGGLLGSWMGKLSVGEIELLILAASLHDLGMVYTEEEKHKYYNDKIRCREFAREYCPELLRCSGEEWPEDIQQWYLCVMHPFRIPEVLEEETWKKIFDFQPRGMVSAECIIAVCQAHGETLQEIRNNRKLDYLPASEVDPLFCALLLRLSDLMDFDDTRAPKVLYSSVVDDKKSQEEWDKHQASMGFSFPLNPSNNDLPYRAHCTNPNIEHALRKFLDWIDDELKNFMQLQRYCNRDWHQHFPLPRAVLRNEIESDGYMSGDFCMTMGQEQILKLLTGENMYYSRSSFVRELLQNAVDATLLRAEMDSGFEIEKARIDIWEWSDEEGDIWFRIDDQGIGMTMGMLQRYFLKVGNSYYASQELERDLHDHNKAGTYYGISGFGIGFLSSFLCGDYVEVSTLYFDPEKNRREESGESSAHMVRYGIRLQMSGLKGYYILKNQAKQHSAGIFPSPKDYSLEEKGDYRTNPGTSIVVRLNPGKLESLDLHRVVECYLCGTEMPVYYNNKQIGRTFRELMQEAHKEAGTKIYEMNSEGRKKFDKTFPNASGSYPKVSVTTVPLDEELENILSDISGVLLRYEVYFDKTPNWKIKDQMYEMHIYSFGGEERPFMLLESRNCKEIPRDFKYWKELIKDYDSEYVTALEAELDRLPDCPSEKQLGSVWDPFIKDLDVNMIWRSYYDSKQIAAEAFGVEDYNYPDIQKISLYIPAANIVYTYQGIEAGAVINSYVDRYSSNMIYVLFWMKGQWKLVTSINRWSIIEIPLKALLVMSSIICKYNTADRHIWSWGSLKEWRKSSLQEWRMACSGQVDEWLQKNHQDLFEKEKCNLQRAVKNREWKPFAVHCYPNESGVLKKYYMTFLQDHYDMEINYEKGQIISFYKNENGADEAYDIFPPMMFCKAASDESRQYICCIVSDYRRGLTLDHPYVAWLLRNAKELKKYFQRQFEEIVDVLCSGNGEVIVSVCNGFREKMAILRDHHGVDINNCPKISIEDFWISED